MIETFYTSLYLEKYGEKFRSIVAVIAKETMGGEFIPYEAANGKDLQLGENDLLPICL